MEEFVTNSEGEIVSLEEYPDLRPRDTRKRTVLIVIVFCVLFLALWCLYVYKTWEQWEGVYELHGADGAHYRVQIEALEGGDYAVGMLAENSPADCVGRAVLSRSEMMGRDVKVFLDGPEAPIKIRLYLQRKDSLDISYIYPAERGSRLKTKTIRLEQLK